MKNRGAILAFVLFITLAVVATLSGCGVWDTLTGNDDSMYIKGDTGQSCTVDSECRSNQCNYPGVCE